MPIFTTEINRSSFADVLIYGIPVVVDGRTIAVYGNYVDIADRIEAEPVPLTITQSIPCGLLLNEI